MAIATRELRDTEDYAVETPGGEIGRVEEVLLGQSGDPEALAVRTSDGGHALLRDEDVVTVDREYRWVVVGEDATLELPSGEVVHPEPAVRTPRIVTFFRRHAPHLAGRPLWQLVAVLYAALAFIVVFAVALVFVVSWVATGSPY
jgi:hypothetical protein